MAERPGQGRAFAIVPAAGHSRRMGQPKLLLPFGRTTVIERVLAAWLGSGVSEVVTVVRQNDTELGAVCRAAGATVVVPVVDPPDMKASILAGLDFLQEHRQPSPLDCWLAAPADAPRMRTAVIDQLLRAFAGAGQGILVPTFRGRRGHPVLLPWALAAAVSALDTRQGINALLDQHQVTELELGDGTVLDDLDTPGDYRRLRDAPR